MRAVALDRYGRILAGAVSVWAAYWFVVMAWHGGRSWHFFVDGAQALADLDDAVAGGLHLYAAAPVLQIGPVALLAALVLLPAGSAAALFGWQLLGALGGLFLLWQFRAIAVRARPDLGAGQLERRLALVAVFFLPVWMYLAVGSTHVDDVLALLFAVGALSAAQRGRSWLSGLLLGLAVDAKPWALGFAAVLLVLGERRRVLRAAAVMTAVVLAAWAPFLLADPGTTNAVRFTIPNTELSALRVLGVDDPRTPPWDRPAQALLGIGLGLMLLYRGRWPALILVAVAARVVLDPGTNRYYLAGLAVGAALWDVVGSRSRVPWWSAAACLGLFGGRELPVPPQVHGWLTLGYFLACCALAFAPGDGPRGPRDGDRMRIHRRLADLRRR